MERTEPKTNPTWIGATLVAAFLASLCCITPVLALLAGISGAAAAFSWMEPYRPVFIGLSVLVLGFAWYQKLKPKKAAVDCACDDEEEKPFLQSKTFLGIVTALAVLLLSFPYYSGVFFAGNEQESAQVAQRNVLQARLAIEGMTCTGCESSVNHALSGKKGVVEAIADYETGTALVKYDASVVDPDALKEVIEKEVGYKVTKMEIVQQ